MRLIHRDRTEPPLPKMAGGAHAGVDIARIAPMQIAEGSPQAVLILRHQHDVDMIGHQAIGPDLATRPLRRIGQQTEIERSEEHTSELQSLMRLTYAVFCLKKKNTIIKRNAPHQRTITQKYNKCVIQCTTTK